MILELKRDPSNEVCTIGNLYVDGSWECYTLEDIVRAEKVHGETAIPAGSYDVIVSLSPRFKKQLPLVQNVPGFQGIRIHPGNVAADTEGCILPGQTNPTPYSVGKSGLAFEALMQKIQAALRADQRVTLIVT